VSDEPLDQANRLAIVLAAMLVIFAALLVVLLAWGASAGSIGRIEDLAGWLRRHDDTETKTIITLGATVIVLLMLSAIILVVTPSPTQRMRLRTVKAGGATITTREIAARINAGVRQVEHVAACDTIVATHGKRLEVVLDLHLEPGADLARAADEACGRAQALVEQEIGVELAAAPRARLHYRELRLRGETHPTREERTTAPSGWERPQDAEGERDERGQPDAPEEAQA
jgi:hypothetical protein